LLLEEVEVQKSTALVDVAKRRAEVLRSDLPESLIYQAMMEDKGYIAGMATETDRLRTTERALNGLRDAHPDYADLMKTRIDIQRTLVLERERVLAFHRTQLQSQRKEQASTLELEATLHLDSAVALRDALRTTAANLKEEIAAQLKADRDRARRMEEETLVKEQLAALDQRLGQLYVESRAPAQVTLSSTSGPARNPSSDRRPLAWVAGIFGAGLMGVLGAMLAEKRKSPVCSRADVERLGLKVLVDARGGTCSLMPRILPAAAHPQTGRTSLVLAGLHADDAILHDIAEQVLKEASVEQLSALLSFHQGERLEDNLNLPVEKSGRILRWHVSGTPERIPMLLSQPTSLKTWEKFQEMAWFCVATAPSQEPMAAVSMYLMRGASMVVVVRVNQSSAQELLQLKAEVERTGSRIVGVILINEGSDAWAR
jgi:hypothetical protein